MTKSTIQNHIGRWKWLRFLATVILISTSLILISTLLAGRINAQEAIAPITQKTSRFLWYEYKQNPNTHPHIPNNSYAGYRHSDVLIPSPPVVNTIQKYGGKGDGITDNTKAFNTAIAETAKDGGGAILIPEGNYVVKGFIHLNQSGVVLRGAGVDNTVISFTRPLKEVIYPLNYNQAQSRWSWLGGLVWISPSDTFNADGEILTVTKEIARGETSSDAWEQWRYPQTYLAKVIGTSRRGDFAIQVDSLVNLKPGMFVLMTWKNPRDYSFMKYVAGSPLMAKYPWNTVKAKPEYNWPVQIDKIVGNTVYLKQPLRLDVLPEWKVGFKAIGSYIQESGIENLTINMLGTPLRTTHLENLGYNGIYFNRAINCWTRNITIKNAENGLIISQSKNITAKKINFTGDVKMHHATANRFAAADILISDFQINSQVFHGINVENFSSGNVWSRGKMLHGTFDSHRGLPFDVIRTEISTQNDSSPGGAKKAGPFNGKNVVHWNVNVTGNLAKFVYQPDAHSSGTLVGIRGVAIDLSCAWAMVCGDKNVVVADDGLTPIPGNLYEAQLTLRRRRK